jgi:hypothetical protein
VGFGIHYFSEAGPPSNAKVVVNGNCSDITRIAGTPADQIVMPDPDMGMGMDPVLPYSGETFSVELPLGPGCFLYVYAVTDGEGFSYTYPEFGALQVNVDTEGKVVPNDSLCPIWTPTRANLECLPTGTDCQVGEERPCYTGRPGTESRGICKQGVEDCRKGRWSGVCRDQVIPERFDSCADTLDNDCDSVVNENCGDEMVQPMEDMGSGQDMGGGDMSSQEDMGVEPKDMGGSQPDPPAEEEGSCTVASSHGKVPSQGWIIMVLTTLGLFLRRRR